MKQSFLIAESYADKDALALEINVSDRKLA
jgi:hypothetical protein